jgi:HK97 family phage prohead protease/HK97 family phage major capsid protein
MTIKNKVLYLNSQFTKELPTADEPIDNIYISGYASVNNVDRAGDVVPSSVWEKGMQNYLKNPIVLAYHDHDDPIGRVTDHKVDTKGLWVKARISAASEVFNLIKDGILTAFSVGFRVLDAEYNAATELFIIKELELHEISVVSVPCNQDTLFSLSKSFDNDEEYKEFKTLFAPKNTSAKGLETQKVATSITTKEIGMDPKELEQMLAAAAEKAALNATKALLDAQAEEARKKALADAEEKAMQDRINKAVALVTPSNTGAEKLMAELAARVEASEATNKSLIDGLEATLKEKATELEAMRNSKMTFDDKNKDTGDYADRETAVLLSKITGKSIESTKFGKDLIAKTGAHMASATWELEVSLSMEAEVRRRLVVAPILRGISMKTNVMTIPVNPEAGVATWITNAQFGTTASPGAAQTHQLKEITLNAYKVATMEYLAYEEEEDTLLVLMPIVRDAMVRRVALAVDKAYLLGAGAGADPVKGLAIYDATSAVQATNTGAASIANMRALRKDLGAWGLDTADVQYIVSTDIYYDLLDDTLFQTMDKVGVKATLLTGQVGTIGNSPVLVSSQFPTKAGGSTSATTNIGAIAVASANFLAGNQRGLRFDTQDLVETQRKVLVASLRTGVTQVTTNLGQGVSTFRWS